jgi:hypothetical protein
LTKSNPHVTLFLIVVDYDGKKRVAPKEAENLYIRGLVTDIALNQSLSGV